MGSIPPCLDAGLRPIRVDKLPWYQIAPLKDIAGDNPHEKHPRSTITRLTLGYGSSASEIGPPKIPDLAKRLAKAKITETSAKFPRRVPWLRGRSFLWVPIVAACSLAIATFGTPHILFEYQVRPNPFGERRCVYFGLGGFKATTLEKECTVLRLLPHWREA